MTTATKADPIAEQAALEEQLAAAREERARLGREAREYGDNLAATEAELRHLARTASDQFGPDGNPKPKTEAAKLQAELDQAAKSKWSEILEGADRLVAGLDAEVRGTIAANAVELATREYRAGEDELAAVDALAEQVLALLSSLDGRRTRLMQVCASCVGRIDGRDVLSDDRLDRLRNLLTEHPTFRPPRSVTLTPLVGEEPRVVRGREGDGWIGAHHGSDNAADEQPLRLEPRR